MTKARHTHPGTLIRLHLNMATPRLVSEVTVCRQRSDELVLYVGDEWVTSHDYDSYNEVLCVIRCHRFTAFHPLEEAIYDGLLRKGVASERVHNADLYRVPLDLFACILSDAIANIGIREETVRARWGHP
jgi:hypothetical protein